MFPAPVNPDTVRHCLITFSTIVTPVAFIEQAGGRSITIATCATARSRFTGKCRAARLQADESTRRAAGVSLAPPRSSVGDTKYACMAGGPSRQGRYRVCQRIVVHPLIASPGASREGIVTSSQDICNCTVPTSQTTADFNVLRVSSQRMSRCRGFCHTFTAHECRHM